MYLQNPSDLVMRKTAFEGKNTIFSITPTHEVYSSLIFFFLFTGDLHIT